MSYLKKGQDLSLQFRHTHKITQNKLKSSAQKTMRPYASGSKFKSINKQSKYSPSNLR